MFRYERLKEVVDPTVDVSDLAINEADKILLLLRSLPESCRQFLTLHVPIQTFKNLCDAALKYEAQQRAWTELNSKPIAPFKGEKGDKGKGKDGKGKKGKGKQNDQKGKGKSANQSAESSPNASSPETRTCFTCGERGHLANKCPKKGSAPPNKKGGNGKGKGKKGKRATELTESQSEAGDNESAWSEVGDGDVPTRLSMFMFSQPETKFQPGVFADSRFDRDLQRFSVPRFRRGLILRFWAWLVWVFHVICVSSWPVASKGDRMSNAFLHSIRMECDEPGYWLVDSGASRSVIHPEALKHYRVLRERLLQPPLSFSTADGNQVTCEREVFIEVNLPYVEEETCSEKGPSDSKTRWTRFEVRATVGPVTHNLLAVSQLARSGNSFVLGFRWVLH